MPAHEGEPSLLSSQRGPIAKQRWAGLDQKLVARLTGLVNDLNGVGSFIELIQYFSSHN